MNDRNIDSTIKSFNKSVNNKSIVEKENDEILASIFKIPKLNGKPVSTEEEWKMLDTGDKIKIIDHYKIVNKTKNTREKLRSKRKSKRK